VNGRTPGTKHRRGWGVYTVKGGQQKRPRSEAKRQLAKCNKNHHNGGLEGGNGKQRAPIKALIEKRLKRGKKNRQEGRFRCKSGRTTEQSEHALRLPANHEGKKITAGGMPLESQPPGPAIPNPDRTLRYLRRPLPPKKKTPKENERRPKKRGRSGGKCRTDYVSFHRGRDDSKYSPMCHYEIFNKEQPNMTGC